MLLSIVVPLYNAQSYIPKCLDILLRQGIADDQFEIIAVDDGSTDSTYELCRQLQQAHHQLVVVHQRNAGAGAARNRGIDLANGEFLYFFDVDDDLDEGALSELLFRCVQDNLDVLFFGGDVRYDNEAVAETFHQDPRYFRRLQSPGIRNGEDMFIAQQSMGNFCAQPCMLITRLSFIRQKNVRFAEGIINEDNLFVLHATLRADRADVDQRPLYHYCVHSGTVTTSNVNGEQRFLAHLVLANEFERDRLEALAHNKVELAELIGRLVNWFIRISVESCPTELETAGLLSNPHFSTNMLSALLIRRLRDIMQDTMVAEPSSDLPQQESSQIKPRSIYRKISGLLHRQWS
ncbi:glycosyltransferase [Enorma phocaeensis]|uniref:Glycosyltransferase n=1 Tax=Enorma phocaeensis TaxID=1871019 RepID=A0ABT7VBG3_9ACTN|nr:glycosyltransferase [Enorma phocaeensis]MDM8275821.1 glycosyltransferase [Enorma phocaeensis]